MDETLPVDPLQPVAANVQVHELEAGLHVVVVAQLLDLIVSQIQPQKGLWDEGVVEPLESVVGDVEPLQMVLRVEQAVQLLEAVVVEAEGLENQFGDIIIYSSIGIVNNDAACSSLAQWQLVKAGSRSKGGEIDPNGRREARKNPRSESRNHKAAKFFRGIIRFRCRSRRHSGFQWGRRRRR